MLLDLTSEMVVLGSETVDSNMTMINSYATGCTSIEVSYETDIAPGNSIDIEVLGAGQVYDSGRVGGGSIILNGNKTITGIEITIY